MARSAIPDFGIEYPEYVYRAWPKHVGFDEAGEALTANNQAEFDELKELAVFPKVLGRDRHGNDVVAATPRDEDFAKARVVKTVEVAATEVNNSLTGEPRRGPGRPPNASKSEAA
jgi:hypothetical protein